MKLKLIAGKTKSSVVNVAKFQIESVIGLSAVLGFVAFYHIFDHLIIFAFRLAFAG